MPAKMKVKAKKVKKAVEESPDDRRSRLAEIIDEVNSKWVEFSVIAAKVYDNEEYHQWGYESAKDYVKEDVGLEYRTFQDRVHMGRVIIQHGISWEVIKDIGPSNFKQIAYLINEKTTNRQFNTLINKAKKMPHRELKEYVRKQRLEAQGITHYTKKVTRVFKLRDDQAEVVDNAINDMAVRAGLDEKDPNKDNIALDRICAWYLFECVDRPVPSEILEAVKELEEEQKVKHKKHSNAGRKKSKKK